MIKKLILGILISSLFIYLSFKGIDLKGVVSGIKAANPIYLFYTVGLLILMQVLRSYRWGIILNPVKKVDQFSLFSVTSVGFLAVIAIPARIGELARPYLISNQKDIKMTSAVGTILVERVFDSLTVLLTFFIVVSYTSLPPWLIKTSIIFLFISLAFLGFIILCIYKRDSSLRILTPLLKKLPGKSYLKLVELVNHLIDGFEIISNGKLILFLAFLSILIWGIDASAIYMLFFAFDINLPLSAAFVLMVIIILGITIPTAPGFVGNWHFFCILGLNLFGISKTDALTYAIVLHFLSIGIIVVLGLIFLPFNKFSFSDIRQKLNFKNSLPENQDGQGIKR